MFGKHLTQKEFVGEKINGILPEYVKKHFKIQISTILMLTGRMFSLTEAAKDRYSYL